MSGYAEAASRLFELGRYELAAEYYRKAIAARPWDNRSRCTLALALTNAGRHAEAEVAIADALAQSPNYCYAHHTKGAVLRRQGRAEESIAHIERGISLHPSGTYHHMELSYALEQVGRREASLEAAERALQLEPESVDALAQRTHLLCDLGRTDDAQQGTEALLRLAPTLAAGHGYRGFLHGARGEYAKSEQAYLEALAINPELQWVHSNLEWTRSRLRGNPEPAVPFGIEALSHFVYGLRAALGYQRPWFGVHLVSLVALALIVGLLLAAVLAMYSHVWARGVLMPGVFAVVLAALALWSWESVERLHRRLLQPRIADRSPDRIDRLQAVTLMAVVGMVVSALVHRSWSVAFWALAPLTAFPTLNLRRKVPDESSGHWRSAFGIQVSFLVLTSLLTLLYSETKAGFVALCYGWIGAGVAHVVLRRHVDLEG